MTPQLREPRRSNAPRLRRALLVGLTLALALWWLLDDDPPVADSTGTGAVGSGGFDPVESPAEVARSIEPARAVAEAEAPAPAAPEEPVRETVAPAEEEPPASGDAGGSGAGSPGEGPLADGALPGEALPAGPLPGGSGLLPGGTSPGTGFDPFAPGGTESADASDAPPVLVARTRYEVDFKGGDDDWRPRNARVSPAGDNRTAGFPGVPFPSGYRVEPWDTRTPDQRELNLPMGRPRLVCGELAWVAAEVDEILVRAAFVADGKARVYFQVGEPGAETSSRFDPDDYVEIDVRGEEGMGEWLFPMRDHAHWRGTITGLRLDLVDRRLPYLIDRLRARQRTGG